MTSPASQILRWTPRILGLLIALFTGIFALDVFGRGASIWEEILGFLIHLLVPTILLLIAVALAWRWPLVGAVVFLGWAIFYLGMAWGRFDITAYLLISGIPALVGLLFLWDWLHRRKRAVNE